MSIADILVYADPSPASGERLDLAFRLAHKLGAYLIGVVPEDEAPVGERFETMLRQEALQGDWQMAIGLSASFVTRRAHAADLVILGQRIPDLSTGLDAPEDVILACSRLPRAPKPKVSPGSSRSTICRLPSAVAENRRATPDATRYQ